MQTCSTAEKERRKKNALISSSKIDATLAAKKTLQGGCQLSTKQASGGASQIFCSRDQSHQRELWVITVSRRFRQVHDVAVRVPRLEPFLQLRVHQPDTVQLVSQRYPAVSKFAPFLISFYLLHLRNVAN
jgi:hypothetical protein